MYTATIIAVVFTLDFILHASTMEFYSLTISIIPFTFAKFQKI